MKDKFKLDTLNLRLLTELEKDSRTPLSRIAKTIGTSKEVVHYRFKKLLESGFIKRFHPIIDYFSLDYKCYRLVINLHNLKYHIRKTMIDDLRQVQNIDLNVYLLSNWDLEINIWVQHTEEFYSFYNEFIEKYAEYIMDKNLYVITKIHFFSHAYLHKHHHTMTIGEEKQKKEIDKTDEAVLEILEENPRTEILKIAEKTKLSPSTAHYRIKQLITNRILKTCIPIIDKSLLGYNSYRVGIVLNNPSEKKNLISHLSSQKNITKITELIGRKDLDFEVDFPTTAELDKFLEELRLQAPYIKDFEVINILVD